MFWDVHTHVRKGNTTDESSVFNLNVPDHLCRCGLDLQNSFYSLGIHPWKIYPELLSEHLRFIEENICFDSVKTVGECGLDRVCDTPWDLQIRTFAGQIAISEKYGKPLVIHCVKAFDELLAFKKELNPSQAWIIHGFRGKPEQTEQLIRHGLYLSFGACFNEGSLRKVPLERLFLETDESAIPIKEIYQKAAEVRGITTDVLTGQINPLLLFQ